LSYDFHALAYGFCALSYSLRALNYVHSFIRALAHGFCALDHDFRVLIKRLLLKRSWAPCLINPSHLRKTEAANSVRFLLPQDVVTFALFTGRMRN
jgi:hypothetical protein